MFPSSILAFAGLEDLQGYERFTYGVPALVTGLPWISMMIGLFAVPQLSRLISESDIMADMGELKATLPIIKTMWIHKVGIIKWSGLEMVIGIPPGVGENIAAWEAYGWAKRESKTPSSSVEARWKTCWLRRSPTTRRCRVRFCACWCSVFPAARRRR